MKRRGKEREASGATPILEIALRRRAQRSSPTCQLCAVILLAVVFLGGCATLPPVQVPLVDVPAEQQPRALANLRVFNAVWDLVNRKHFDPKFQGVDWNAAASSFGPKVATAKDETALYATLNAMLAPLKDSHTHALMPVQVVERKTQERARTGFNLTRVESRWVVSDVLPESPAEQAGVKMGWIVAARNGELLTGRINFRPREGEQTSWDFQDDRP